MANLDLTLKDMMTVDGALGAAVVDYDSGMALGHLGGSKALDLQIAAAGNTEVVRAKVRTMEQLRIKEDIEDILISLSSQYHVIRPVTARARACSSTWPSTAPAPTSPSPATASATSRRTSRFDPGADTWQDGWAGAGAPTHPAGVLPPPPRA
ncbi:hypothetical protein BZB76_1015 [Actinomadura pelletieri DSM 43383]|uniref:Uncharacterized protein n=1 Tax=Actinomadura pelletieri DSM 43383 TaxID=1120940 RepID=A0A495R006_9ACTN|nr:hypothetical protein BZB76_1015 [Actinomadura pelletieri DSM 43383]